MLAKCSVILSSSPLLCRMALLSFDKFRYLSFSIDAVAAMSWCDEIVANASDADLHACTGVSRYVFETVFRRYCGDVTPIQTRFVAPIMASHFVF